jgi:hypothetical protein
MLNIKSLATPDVDILAITDKGDESEYMHCSLDHVSDIPSDFLTPIASLIIHEEELGAPIIDEHLYVDREIQNYRPYTAAEFKARSALLNIEV